MKLADNYFRAGAGAVIIDRSGRVLVLERSDIPGSWQFPQGGLDKGEEPYAAALREVEEETGISPGQLDYLRQYPSPLVYELPPEARSKKTGRGQVQYWYLFRFKGEEDNIDLSASKEFSSWQWTYGYSAVDGVVAFKREVYEKLISYFADFLLLD